MTIQYIAWNDLVASKRNRRKVKADVAGLALNLAADGLLQNLVVLPREDGKYEVIAGERRRRAIVQLVKSRTWERDVSIPRSEEHTSELQSLMRISYAVFCLKKKNTHVTKKANIQHNIDNQTIRTDGNTK